MGNVEEHVFIWVIYVIVHVFPWILAYFLSRRIKGD